MRGEVQSRCSGKAGAALQEGRGADAKALRHEWQAGACHLGGREIGQFAGVCARCKKATDEFERQIRGWNV